MDQRASNTIVKHIGDFTLTSHILGSGNRGDVFLCKKGSDLFACKTVAQNRLDENENR